MEEENKGYAAGKARTSRVMVSENYEEKVASRDYSDSAMEERKKRIDAARAARLALRARLEEMPSPAPNDLEGGVSQPAHDPRSELLELQWESFQGASHLAVADHSGSNMPSIALNDLESVVSQPTLESHVVSSVPSIAPNDLEGGVSQPAADPLFEFPVLRREPLQGSSHPAVAGHSVSSMPSTAPSDPEKWLSRPALEGHVVSSVPSLAPTDLEGGVSQPAVEGHIVAVYNNTTLSPTSPLDWPCFEASRDCAPPGSSTFFDSSSESLGRAMIDWASTAQDRLFPLLVHHLCDVENLLKQSPHKQVLMAAPTVAVSLERIPRVPDPNQRGQARTDFFVYQCTGDIIRFHPSRDPKKEAKAHHMPAKSCLMHPTVLINGGAGRALHAHPPGNVDQLARVRFTEDHARLLNAFDTKVHGWKSARAFLESLDFTNENEIDLTDGHLWPWWLFLGNTGGIRKILAGGVISVHAKQLKEWSDMRAFVVTTTECTHCIWSDNKHKMMISDY